MNSILCGTGGNCFKTTLNATENVFNSHEYRQKYFFFSHDNVNVRNKMYI